MSASGMSLGLEPSLREFDSLHPDLSCGRCSKAERFLAMEDPVGSIPITRSLMIMVAEAEESRRCVVAAVQAGSSPVDHPHVPVA